MENKMLKYVIILLSIFFISNCATVGRPLILQKANNEKLFVYSVPCAKSNTSQCAPNLVEEYICSADKNGDLECKSLYDNYNLKNELKRIGAQK
jgi:hypothetical protein